MVVLKMGDKVVEGDCNERSSNFGVAQQLVAVVSGLSAQTKTLATR